MAPDPHDPAVRRRADAARARFLARQARLQREEAERAPRDAERAQAAGADPVAAALARARARNKAIE
jgi:Na+-translocating ferredoxin:NAD+ oxidoreductase RnfC subunit